MNRIPFSLGSDNKIFLITEHVREGGAMMYPYPTLGVNEKILEVRVSMANSDALVEIIVQRQEGGDSFTSRTLLPK